VSTTTSPAPRQPPAATPAAVTPVATRGAPVRRRPPLKLRLAALYRNTIFNPFWTDTRHLRRSVATLAPFASGRLLDVGVGERPYGRIFEPRVSRYFGLEYPPAAENLSPEITGARAANLKGAVDVWGDGGALPFMDQSFDTVLCLELLEHVPQPDRCLAEIARTLRPGGALLVTVPFVAALHALPYDYWRYTPAGLTELLARHGLKVESLVPRGNVASAAASMTSQYLLRAVGARHEWRDGSMSISRWRAPFVLPLVGLIQALFALLERLTTDSGACLGYTVVARRSA
jgi:SAM-dependent methyltransferase